MTEIYVDDGVHNAFSASVSPFMADLLSPGGGCPNLVNGGKAAETLHVAEDVSYEFVLGHVAVETSIE